MRAFIFSLDAFVAFTLALIAIYSLIFFSSIPSSYYYLLTQGHFLSRDVLMALSTTTCVQSYYCLNPEASLLDNIASDKWDKNQDGSMPGRDSLVQATVGKMIPVQFGYTIESIDSQGASVPVYDTAKGDAGLPPAQQHAVTSKKLSISAEVMTFGYSSAYAKPSASTYRYLSCNDGNPNAPMITCGLSDNQDPSSNGDIVPSANVKVMKLTVFI